jgi:phosphopantothenate---cysteine ligase (ATP)
VILLHRAGCFMPFSSAFRQLLSPHVDLQLLDCLAAAPRQDGSTALQLRPPEQAGPGGGDATAALLQELQRYQQHRHRLLALPFTSIDDYLSLLEAVSVTITQQRRQQSSEQRRRVIYFLAAAVSDFYVPPELLPQHKIQSGPLPPADPDKEVQPEQQQQQQQGQEEEEEEEEEGQEGGQEEGQGAAAAAASSSLLRLELHPVPKRLGVLVESWAPGAFVTSFKLETDPALLQTKAQMALRKYHVHLVVANQLQVTGRLTHSLTY